MHDESHDIAERRIIEATARVTWGEFPEDVTAYLVGQGMDVREARALVKDLVSRRNSEVRRRSIVKLVKGILLLLAAAVCCNLFFNYQGGSRLWGRLLGAVTLGLGLSGVAAIWRGINGLAFPQVEELTDVEEGFDPPDEMPRLPGG